MRAGILGQAAIGTSQSAIFTAATTTVISTVFACNTTGGNLGLYLNAVPEGQLGSEINALYQNASVNSYSTLACTAGITLGPGDAIWAHGSANGFTITIFGSELE